MDNHRPLLGYAGPDPVRAFHFLRPNTAKPNPPALEFLSLGWISAVVNRNPFAIAQQDDVSRFAKNCIKAIQLFLGIGDDSAAGFPRSSKLTVGKYVGCRVAVRIKTISRRAPSPRLCNLLGTGNDVGPLDNRADLVDVRQYLFLTYHPKLDCGRHNFLPTFRRCEEILWVRLASGNLRTMNGIPRSRANS